MHSTVTRLLVRYFIYGFFALQLSVLLLAITFTLSPEMFFKDSVRGRYPGSYYNNNEFGVIVPPHINSADPLPSNNSYPLYPVIRQYSLDYNSIALLFSLYFLTGFLIALTIDHFSSRSFLFGLKIVTTIMVLIIMYLGSISAYNFSKRVRESYETSCKLTPLNPQIENGKLVEQCPPRIDWFIEEYIKQSDKYGYNNRYSY